MEQLNFQIYFNFNIEVTFISWKARVPIDFWKSTKQPYISETRRKISVIELIGFQNICFRLLVNIMEGSFILLRKNTEQPSNSRTRKTIAVTSCDNWISKYILRPIIGGGVVTSNHTFLTRITYAFFHLFTAHVIKYISFS